MQKVRYIRLIFLAVGLIGALLGLAFSKSNNVLSPVFLVVAGIGVLGHVIYTMIAWHCPHCGRLLPTKHGFWSKYCPYCGEMLDKK
jgi:hypothetical protein